MENFKINTMIGNSNICSRNVAVSCSYPLNDSITPNISDQQFSQFGSNGQIPTFQYASSTSTPIQTNHSGILDGSQVSFSSSYNNMNASCTPYATYSNSDQQFCDPPQQFCDLPHNPTQQICDPPQQFRNPPQQICNPPQQICNPPQQFCNPPQQFCNPPQQFCNPTQQLSNPTQQLCNPTRQLSNPTQQLCNPPQQFCNTQRIYHSTHQFCNIPYQFCNSTRQFYNPPYQICNPTRQFCNLSHQFYDPTQQFYDPTHQFYDPTHQFYDPSHQFYDPTHQFYDPIQQQRQFNYEISGYMPTDNQQSAAHINALMNGPQFDTNGHILASQSTLSSLRIPDNDPQNNCNCMNNSLLSYAMSSNCGQQFSTITCQQNNQSYSPSQQQHN